jgi:hypothetical protein
VGSNNKIPKDKEFIEELKLLTSQGLTVKEILLLKKLDIAPASIRIFMKNNNIVPNKFNRFKDKSRLCEGCKKTFEYKQNRDKYCSWECYNGARPTDRKYSLEDKIKVINLKKEKKTNKEIEELTRVNINKIKEIIKENNLFLNLEDITINSQKAKSKNNPLHLEHMRSFINENSHKKIKNSLIDFYKTEEAKEIRSKISNSSRNMWKALRETPEKLEDYLNRRSKESQLSVLGLSEEELEEKFLRIKLAIDSKNSTIAREAEKEKISVSAIYRGFHKRKWQSSLYLNISNGQIELFEYIESLVGKGNVVLNDRTFGVEADVYVPSLKVAFEYDGLYWHSRANKTQYEGKHSKKYKIFKENNVKFLAIYEDEWQNNIDLIKGAIKQKLGLNIGKKYRASDLEIKKLYKNREFEDFFEKNHLDGNSSNASFAYALLEPDSKEVLFCMSFRNSSEGYLELARMATKMNINVMGGPSRILKELDHKLVSYSNNRLSHGDVYKTLGFKEITLTEDAGYYYTDFKVRINRYQCQKINDPDILEYFPTEEEQAMGGVFSLKIFGDNRPLYKIHHYGNRKWLKSKDFDEILDILYKKYQDQEYIEAWLNSPKSQLDGEKPIALINKGQEFKILAIIK